MGNTFVVKVTSENEITGEVTSEEIAFSSLTVPELQKMIKDVHGLALSQADTEGLLRGEKVTFYEWQGMTFLSWGNG